MVHQENPTENAQSQSFQLRDWQVLPEQNRIVRGEETIHLEPRVMDLLVFMARHAGTVISKHDIIDSVWQQQIVADSALSRCMALLRSSLGDDAASPMYIETISKRGYRLIADVHDITSRSDASGSNPSAFRIRVGEEEVTLSQGESSIGRHPTCVVFVDSPKVSRRHATIHIVGGRANLEDAGSKNGTYLGGVRLTAPVVLANGDEIIVGNTMLKFLVSGEDSGTETMSESDEPAQQA